jgi:hypothetical protein
MARSSLALLLALLLACAFIQSSYSSRPSPGEKSVVLSPVLHPGTGEHRHRDGTAKVNDDGATTLAPLVDDGGVESVQKKGGAGMVLSSKLARRSLEEGAAGDSAAKSSCRSNDASVTCPPPALH